ncbi:MAG: hypothetical protein J6W61_01470 [Bacteroidales bacterium]|nr:hypothetical protein [Bacteroidales bacterium]
MDKDFNFDQIGNKMPYNVPEGFFDQLEENVLAEIKAEKLEIQQTKQKSNAIRKTFCVIFSAAAAFALFFVVTKNNPRIWRRADSFYSVELAFDNLCAEDQAYLMELYSDDVFLLTTCN